jgi:mono/diheme cytochrome c family protein
MAATVSHFSTKLRTFLGNAIQRLTMHRVLSLGTTAAVTLVAQLQILAQPLETGNVSSGHQIASTICGNCHEISPTMSPRTAVGPKFEDIANLPSTTALSLRAFLLSNHKRMPNFIISKADTDDVVAYILSLKQK